MPTISWKGSAPAIAGVTKWTFTTAGTIGDIITVTVGSKSYAYTTTSATIATFLPLLATALEALSATTYPEFAEITWSSVSPLLVATNDTAGRPSIITVSTNSATTTINSGTVTGATNATPIVITSTAHGLASGSTVTVASVGGNTAANGTWVITVVDANSFSLRTSVGNGAYTSGGTWTAATGSTTTISSGPHDISTAANYSGGALPVASDTLIIDLEGARLKYGLQTQSAVVLASRRIVAKDVEIGLPATNRDGTAYTEYRQTYWQQTATADYVNTDSGRIKLDHLAGLTTYEQDKSGNGTETGIPAVLLKGTHASNAWTINGGNAGIAFFAGETSTILTLNVGPRTTVALGTGCTNATLTNYGGTLYVNSAIATALNHPSAGGGTTTIEGTGTVAQITMQSGTCHYNTTGILSGTTVLGGSATLTFDDDQRAKDVTNPVKIYSSTVTFSDIKAVIAGGYTLEYHNCAPASLRVCPHSDVTVATMDP